MGLFYATSSRSPAVLELRAHLSSSATQRGGRRQLRSNEKGIGQTKHRWNSRQASIATTWRWRKRVSAPRSYCAARCIHASVYYNGMHARLFAELQGLRNNVPGEPGVDYPAYKRLPRTSFSCSGKDRGYYADEEAGCQVFHVCDSGHTSSFLCPIGSLFSQRLLTCDWWTKVPCSETKKHYFKLFQDYDTELEDRQKVHQTLSNHQDSDYQDQDREHNKVISIVSRQENNLNYENKYQTRGSLRSNEPVIVPMTDSPVIRIKTIDEDTELRSKPKISAQNARYRVRGSKYTTPKTTRYYTTTPSYYKTSSTESFKNPTESTVQNLHLSYSTEKYEENVSTTKSNEYKEDMIGKESIGLVSSGTERKVEEVEQKLELETTTAVPTTLVADQEAAKSSTGENLIYATETPVAETTTAQYETEATTLPNLDERSVETTTSYTFPDNDDYFTGATEIPSTDENSSFRINVQEFETTLPSEVGSTESPLANENKATNASEQVADSHVESNAPFAVTLTLNDTEKQLEIQTPLDSQSLSKLISQRIEQPVDSSESEAVKPKQTEAESPAVTTQRSYLFTRTTPSSRASESIYNRKAPSRGRVNYRGRRPVSSSTTTTQAPQRYYAANDDYEEEDAAVAYKKANQNFNSRRGPVRNYQSNYFGQKYRTRGEQPRFASNYREPARDYENGEDDRVEYHTNRQLPQQYLEEPPKVEPQRSVEFRRRRPQQVRSNVRPNTDNYQNVDYQQNVEYQQREVPNYYEERNNYEKYGSRVSPSRNRKVNKFREVTEAPLLPIEQTNPYEINAGLQDKPSNVLYAMSQVANVDASVPRTPSAKQNAKQRYRYQDSRQNYFDDRNMPLGESDFEAPIYNYEAFGHDASETDSYAQPPSYGLNDPQYQNFEAPPPVSQAQVNYYDTAAPQKPSMMLHRVYQDIPEPDFNLYRIMKSRSYRKKLELIQEHMNVDLDEDDDSPVTPSSYSPERINSLRYSNAESTLKSNSTESPAKATFETEFIPALGFEIGSERGKQEYLEAVKKGLVEDAQPSDQYLKPPSGLVVNVTDANDKATYNDAKDYNEDSHRFDYSEEDTSETK
uniref:Chitin-binding type-2 domain-containing protein n=1 Tax=Trichogramma kaykai TaxID=54128 RepID=A0ABD2WUD4_9HYME